MKNNLFGKATALAMGSLMIFSGQALAIKSNNQKIIDAEALNNSEIVIAQQDTGRACAQVQVGVAILGQIITKIKQVLEIQPRGEIPPEFRDQIESALIESLREAINAFAKARVIAMNAEKDDNKELVITITRVISVLSQVAQAIASGVGEVSQLEMLLEMLIEAKADAEGACQFQ